MERYDDRAYGLMQVGAGWRGIVGRLYDLVDQVRAAGAEVTVAQVKEKFGGLRFYYDGDNALLAFAVRSAEDEAWRTCEECGAPGVLRYNRSWYKTLCDAHQRPNDVIRGVWESAK